MNKKNHILSIVVFISFLVLLGSLPVSALSCSFSYSSKGNCVYLTPSLSSDAVYYRWSIERVNDTKNAGGTSWIPRNESFIQVFALDYASEYYIVLEVKDSGNNIVSFSRFVHTSTSSLSVQDGLIITERQEEQTGRINFVNAFMDYFNDLPVIAKMFFVIFFLIIALFVISILFSTGWKKGLIKKFK